MPRIANVCYWSVVETLDDMRFFMKLHEARQLQQKLGMGYIKTRTEVAQPSLGSDGINYIVLIKLVPKDVPTEENVPFNVGYLYVGKSMIAMVLKEITAGGATVKANSVYDTKYWSASGFDEMKEIIGEIIKYYKKDLVPKWDKVDFKVGSVGLRYQVPEDILSTGKFRDPRGFSDKIEGGLRRKFVKDMIYILEVIGRERDEEGGAWLLRLEEKGSDRPILWVLPNSKVVNEVIDEITKIMYGLSYRER